MSRWELVAWIVIIWLVLCYLYAMWGLDPLRVFDL